MWGKMRTPISICVNPKGTSEVSSLNMLVTLTAQQATQSPWACTVPVEEPFKVSELAIAKWVEGQQM